MKKVPNFIPYKKGEGSTSLTKDHNIVVGDLKKILEIKTQYTISTYKLEEHNQIRNIKDIKLTQILADDLGHPEYDFHPFVENKKKTPTLFFGIHSYTSSYFDQNNFTLKTIIKNSIKNKKLIGKIPITSGKICFFPLAFDLPSNPFPTKLLISGEEVNKDLIKPFETYDLKDKEIIKFQKELKKRTTKKNSFDGIDDRISVPDDDTLDFGNEHPGWTISAWVLSEGANAYGTEGGQIVGKYWRDGSPGIDYGLLRYKKQNGTIAYQMGLKTDADGGGGWTESDLPVNLDGVGWHHIVATVDLEGKIKKLYYNGTLFDSVNLTLPKNPSHNAELLIGNGPHSSGRNLWKGKLDDIRIYNRALSGQQVKVLYDLN